LGHLTHKIVSEMTYNVSSGTLNPVMLHSCDSSFIGAFVASIISCFTVYVSTISILLIIATVVVSEFHLATCFS